MLSCFELLHFHLGSQISAIRAVKNALREAGRFYVECVKLGAPLKYFDVGGGLGVDYDGSQTNFASSMNYTLQEYANDIVFGLQEICDLSGVPHPVIVTESGRAMVAHHSMLVMDVLGVSEFAVGQDSRIRCRKTRPGSCGTCSTPSARSRARTCARPITTRSNTGRRRCPSSPSATCR